jgi:hypothetical protein
MIGGHVVKEAAFQCGIGERTATLYLYRERQRRGMRTTYQLVAARVLSNLADREHAWLTPPLP